MSKQMGVGDLNFGIFMADLGDSKGGLRVGMVEGSESKSVAENPIDKVDVGNGGRVPEDSKVLDVTSTNGSGMNAFESGSIEHNDLYGGSRSGVADMKLRRNNGWESWGVMDMVGRVLGGNLNMDNEADVMNIPEKEPAAANLELDVNRWQGMIGESMPNYEFGINETLIGKDSSKLDFESRDEANGLNGNRKLTSFEMVPDGGMETEKVDSKDDVTAPLEHIECITEREGEYHVSDLVWGKVRSHPWWPGQILNTSAATDKAKKHFKRNTYLIAYFGDQTFAWNDASKIKPFQMQFSQMEKLSNVDGFCHAVESALKEVSRRTELSLSCPCLPQEVYDMIKFQVLENAGIREESRRRAGGDNMLSATSFLPGELMQFLGSLAQSPVCGPDRLQLTVAKAQLLSFNRWKGFYDLPIYEECGRFLEDGSEVIMKKDVKESLQGPDLESSNNSLSKKRKIAQDFFSRKRKGISSDEERQRRKGKRPSALMSSRSSSKLHERKPTSRKIIPSVILSELTIAAKNPKEASKSGLSLPGFLSEFRNTNCLEKSSPGCTTQDAVEHKGEIPSNLGAADNFGVDGSEDSYWPDRIIQSYPEHQEIPLTDNLRAAELEANTDPVLNLVDNIKERDIGSTGLDGEGSSLPMKEASEEYFPTGLILNFTSLESIPPIENLNEIFRRYGPLQEEDTEVLTKSKRAKLTFKRREDAETAFSSTGKYSIFGPSLVSYRLNYTPSSRKSRAKAKQLRKKGKSLKVDA
ncbi:PWWP domain-containing protein 5-like [Andrographis paniculata]|uniref:PWWP domain-containing protein 5-like n=1 Tax=Andrographis paniculata TaxID=175694 RepID=UPI0021E7A0DB|nr:PWWP domain-containing protein 5-like [Andrographis paniculata]